jgi:hypothetical protein
MVKAKEVLGDEYMREYTQRSWAGDGFFLSCSNVQCFCGAMTDEDWDPNEWKRQIDRKQLENVFGELIDFPAQQKA